MTYRGVPAFVITLAGYLMFRGAAFLVADGQTLAPLATTYQRLGGGVQGAIGPLWSWLLGLLACTAVVAQVVYARRSRARYQAVQPALWADALKVLAACAALLGFVAVMCAYPDPAGSQDAGVPVGKGIALPVLILVGGWRWPCTGWRGARAWAVMCLPTAATPKQRCCRACPRSACWSLCSC